MPGEPPGVYGCDYQTLARIAVLHAEARMALLSRDAQVRPFISQLSLGCHWPPSSLPLCPCAQNVWEEGNGACTIERRKPALCRWLWQSWRKQRHWRIRCRTWNPPDCTSPSATAWAMCSPTSRRTMCVPSRYATSWCRGPHAACSCRCSQCMEGLPFGCAAQICAIQPIVQHMHACAECAGV